MSACGRSDSIPNNAVVSVDGESITKDTFNHWMMVTAVSSQAATTGKPVVPDPPDYTACIAHLEATQPKPVKGAPKPTEAQLKTQCKAQYKSLQSQVLSFLILSKWILGEASSLGVKVSDKEVKKQFDKLKTQQFPKPAEFQKFLSTSGQTVSDLLLRAKLNLLSSKIQQKVINQAAKPQTALSTFAQEFKKKWTAKTDCYAGYVVPDCKQYKAPQPTSTPAPTAPTPAPTPGSAGH